MREAFQSSRSWYVDDSLLLREVRITEGSPSAVSTFPSQKQRIKALIAPQQDLGHSGKDAFGVKPHENAAGKKEGSATTKEEESAPTVDDYTPRFRC